MRRFIVTAAASLPAWCVQCEEETLATHFSLGEALTDAMQRARHEVQRRGQPAQVLRRGRDGRSIVMMTLDPKTEAGEIQAQSA